MINSSVSMTFWRSHVWNVPFFLTNYHPSSCLNVCFCMCDFVYVFLCECVCVCVAGYGCLFESLKMFYKNHVRLVDLKRMILIKSDVYNVTETDFSLGEMKKWNKIPDHLFVLCRIKRRMWWKVNFMCTFFKVILNI